MCTAPSLTWHPFASSPMTDFPPPTFDTIRSLSGQRARWIGTARIAGEPGWVTNTTECSLDRGARPDSGASVPGVQRHPKDIQDRIRPILPNKLTCSRRTNATSRNSSRRSAALSKPKKTFAAGGMTRLVTPGIVDPPAPERSSAP
ncbi:hypothetical protein Franean1_2628 [Parafrankia sp. EAN1pec]|nr:hypothetical protein Franean1_2628 [Frankia sp. EAN1pec]